MPAGVLTPMPVTATRGPAAMVEVSVGVAHAFAATLAEDEVDRLADGGDALEVLFGHRDVEALLEAHDELDEVEAVGVEVLLEAGLFGDGVGLDAQHLDGDLAQGRRVPRHAPSDCFSFDCRLGAVVPPTLSVRASQCPMPEAAVDRDERAGDVAGGIGAEEADDGGHLLGGAEAPERHGRLHDAAPLGGHAVGHGGHDRPRRDDVAGDAARGQLPGDGPGEARASPALAAE